METYKFILIDHPAPRIRRVTLNRPEKRNALNNPLRTEVFQALQEADGDESVHVTVIRGAGKCFSAGYDLAQNSQEGQPYFSPGGDGQWPRHVVQGWFNMWDLAKPVIAQVHGYCLAGAAELATACDLIYVADDAQIGYPPVRLMSPPDMQFYPWLVGLRNAMELMLTGDPISGVEAARMGFANRSFPLKELEARVFEIARRISQIPPELQQLNKRAIHRAMDIMGMRAAIRAGTEIQALGFHQRASKEYRGELSQGLTRAFDLRDSKFGDYRTKKAPRKKSKNMKSQV